MMHAPWCVLPVVAMLAGCTSNPDQSIYVMATTTSISNAPRATPGNVAVKLRPVILPDYLDTTDLVTRIGQHGIVASRTARWGERLSKGVTRSLAADLGYRLQANVITDGSGETPSVQIEVTVGAFDVTSASSVLTATWTVVRQGDSRPTVIRQGKFTTSVAQPGGDLAVVAAMAETVDELSNGIAATALADEVGTVHLESHPNER